MRTGGRLGLALWVGLGAACNPAAPPPPAVANLQAVVRDPLCGPTRVPVRVGDASVCVDVYEAPGLGALPTAMDFEAARAWCEQHDARLCTEHEWESACRGPSGLLYPYGNEFREGACATGLGEPGPAGFRNACRSETGVYDLSGNAAEWIDSGFLKGGDHTADDFSSRCGSRVRMTESGGPRLAGVRCCLDLPQTPTP